MFAVSELCDIANRQPNSCGPLQWAEFVWVTIPSLGAMAELADAEDLKSSGGDTLWVRLPLAPSAALRRASTAERHPMYFDRQKLEELEDKALAPYGVRSKDTKGRA